MTICTLNSHCKNFDFLIEGFLYPHEKIYFGLCFGNFPTVGDLIFARYCLGIQKEHWQKDSSTKMLCEGQLSLRALFAAASVADLICWVYFA